MTTYPAQTPPYRLLEYDFRIILDEWIDIPDIFFFEIYTQTPRHCVYTLTHLAA